MSSTETNRTGPQSPEEREPAVTRDVMPIWMLIVMGMLLYAGAIYLNYYAGGFRANVYEPYGSLERVEALQPEDEGSQLITQGRQLYNSICVACHQASGQGVPGTFPPLAGSEWVTAPTADRLVRIVVNGLQGPIEVNGVQYTNNPPMPGQPQLSAKEIAAVLSFIRQNEPWGHDAGMVTPEQVEKIRKEMGDRASPWTAAELKEIPVGE